MEDQKSEMADSIDRLSPRHRDCLRGVADLQSSKQIAADLNISAKTVDSYLAEAVAILGASSRRDAARQYLAVSGPDNCRGQSSRVEDPPALPATSSAQREKSQDQTLRDLRHWGQPRRLALILLGSFVLVATIGFAVVAAVGLVAIYEQAQARN